MVIVRAIVAVLSALFVIVGVVAIKQGTAWAISDWSSASKTWLLVTMLTLALAGIAWTYLLQPALRRRKERQQAGLRERPEGDRIGNRPGALPSRMPPK